MGLNWTVAEVENYETVCWEKMTAEEAEEAGTTLDELVNQSSFMGGNWFRPNESDLEKLAAGQDFVKRLRPITNALIWATLSVDLRGITEENHVEFWTRLRLCEKLTGAFMNWKDPETGKWESRLITFEEVKSHIGLGTNVSPSTWREWMTKQVDNWRAETLRRADLPNDRGLPQDTKLSQVFEDTCGQMNALKKAMHRHCLEEDREENRRYEKDYTRVCNTQRWLNVSASAWEEIEERLEYEQEGEE